MNSTSISSVSDLMPREAIVEIVCKSEDQGSTNRHNAISDQAKRTVNDGRADRQEQHADNSPGKYAFDVMSAKAQHESHHAHR